MGDVDITKLSLEDRITHKVGETGKMELRLQFSETYPIFTEFIFLFRYGKPGLAAMKS